MKIMKSLSRLVGKVPPSAVYLISSSRFKSSDIARLGHEGIAEAIAEDFKKFFKDAEEDGDFLIADTPKPLPTFGPPLRLSFYVARFSSSSCVREFCPGMEYVELLDFVNSGLNTKLFYQFIETVIKMENSK